MKHTKNKEEWTELFYDTPVHLEDREAKGPTVPGACVQNKKEKIYGITVKHDIEADEAIVISHTQSKECLIYKGTIAKFDAMWELDK